MSSQHSSGDLSRLVEGTSQPQQPLVDDHPRRSTATRSDDGTFSVVSGRLPESQTATHRCRFYRISSKGLPSGSFIYAMVRDTMEEPIASGSLPNGVLVFEERDSSFENVQSKTKYFRESLGNVRVADWRNFGSL
ncbi:MAG TPA: hypothetical protein VN643_01160 [Pyrinomonadaceae bacterium]|nr:hypothetical protein [Pyrinomonadaceae bacterium]